MKFPFVIAPSCHLVLTFRPAAFGFKQRIDKNGVVYGVIRRASTEGKTEAD